MTKKQTLKFSIKQDGTVTEEVTGTVGNECENLTKIIEERLGTVTNVLYKPEYYQKQENVTFQYNQDQN